MSIMKKVSMKKSEDDSAPVKGSLVDAMRAKKKMSAPSSALDDASESDLVAAIMKKRKMMSEGGDVSDSEHDAENPADSWMDFEESALKEDYSDSHEGPQPEDSNEIGDDIDGDKHDMISTIRKRMKKRS